MKTPRGVRELVDHQVRRWSAERRSSIPAPRAPCVAISRLRASGAVELGRQVAEWLDYGFFGRELVDQIASEQHVQRELVAGLDEHVRSAIDRNVLDYFRSRTFTERDYLEHVVRILTTLGERGQAVVLGRGAAFILPPERALRVLVVAPHALRVERFMKQHGLPRDQAEKRLAHEDDERREFLRAQFEVEPNDPTHFDLVVNTGTLSSEAAGRLVVEALRRRFPTDR